MDKKKIEQLIKSLRKNRIEAIRFSSKEQLIDFLIDNLEPDITVGTGDSLTLEQIGIYAFLRNGNINFLDKYKKNITRDEKDKLYRDGNGSRVAPIIYGPKRVFLVCGTNKIVQNDEDGYLSN